MKKLVGALAVLALLLCGCRQESPPPAPIVTATIAPTSLPSYTPSQAELSGRAERVYRTFFNEWTRLEREGGAEEPTQVLLDNGSGGYLKGVMGFLRNQKSTGRIIGGPLPKVTVVAAPGGEFEGVDPRLTLQVCEDHTAAWFEEDGTQYAGELAQGTVYLGYVEGRIKVIGASTKSVEQCTL